MNRMTCIGSNLHATIQLLTWCYYIDENDVIYLNNDNSTQNIINLFIMGCMRKWWKEQGAMCTKKGLGFWDSASNLKVTNWKKDEIFVKITVMLAMDSASSFCNFHFILLHHVWIFWVNNHCGDHHLTANCPHLLPSSDNGNIGRLYYMTWHIYIYIYDFVFISSSSLIFLFP